MLSHVLYCLPDPIMIVTVSPFLKGSENEGYMLKDRLDTNVTMLTTSALQNPLINQSSTLQPENDDQMQPGRHYFHSGGPAATE
jgi:hypothetical protein